MNERRKFLVENNELLVANPFLFEAE